MSRVLALFVLISVLAALPAATAARARDVAPLPTRWMAPPGVERQLHQVWEPQGPFVVREVNLLGAQDRAGEGRVAIVVEEALYGDILSSITDYQDDLAAKGHSSVVALVSGGTPEDLRAYLIGLYGSPERLVGAIFVGNLPYIVYELMQDWGSGPEYEEFPCDIFFMDMNGTWLDNGAGGTVPAGNGKYDVWSDANHRIEIWVGRMRVDTVSQFGPPATVLNNYFRKDHLYRHGALIPETPPATALVYVDDDWGDMVEGEGGDEWCVSLIYGADQVTSIYDVGNPGNNATAADYKFNQMPVDYQFILLRSHGYPGGHGFYRTYRMRFEYVYNEDYMSFDPQGLFYSLFVCSGCDYTAEYGAYGSYLGGTIAFNDDYGLVAWGSAKTGGMWNDAEFYTELGASRSLGAAFVHWFNESHETYPQYAPPWWYGMVLIGDAALVPNADYFPPEVPVGLVAEAASGEIDLHWDANLEGDLDRYEVFRAILGGGEPPALWGTVEAPDTTFEDLQVGYDTTYVYWVTAVDTLNNDSEYSEPDTCAYFATAVAGGGSVPAAGGALLRNHPNPFNPATEISFALEREERVVLRILDVTGRCVRTLVESTLPGGVHAIVWDGRDDGGSAVGSGVYLCRLEREGAPALDRKLVMLK